MRGLSAPQASARPCTEKTWAGVYGAGSWPLTRAKAHTLQWLAELTGLLVAVRGSANGAGNEARTRDLNLGKVTLYQLSYSRLGFGRLGFRRGRYSRVGPETVKATHALKRGWLVFWSKEAEALATRPAKGVTFAGG